MVAAFATSGLAQEPVCSNASWQGSYGLISDGVIGSSSYAALARVVADGNGNLQGTALTTSINGAITRGTFTGTYAVNPDCTGTATVVPSGALPAQARDILVVNHGNRILAISTEQGQAVTIQLDRMFWRAAGGGGTPPPPPADARPRTGSGAFGLLFAVLALAAALRRALRAPRQTVSGR